MKRIDPNAVVEMYRRLGVRPACFFYGQERDGVRYCCILGILKADRDGFEAASRLGREKSADVQVADDLGLSRDYAVALERGWMSGLTWASTISSDDYKVGARDGAIARAVCEAAELWRGS